MSFKECIDNAEKEGQLSKEQIDELRSAYNAEYENNLKSMAPDEADAKAGRDVFNAKQREAIESKRRIVKQRLAQLRAVSQVRQYKGKTVSEGLSAIIEEDGSMKHTGPSVRSRYNGWLRVSGAKISKALIAMRRSKVLGRETKGAKAIGQDFAKEVFGEDSGNALAKELAKSWKETAEMLRLAFNRAGGSIAARTDWGMPQIHNKSAITSVPFEEWKRFIEEKLDWNKMIDERTGKKFLPSERDSILENIYGNIETDGFASVKPTAVVGRGRSLARRRQDHRFLAFKDADSWLAYQQRFGGGDAFEIMTDHIDRMSRDIALLEIMGPNPNSTAQFIKTQMRRDAEMADARLRKDGKKAKHLKKLGRHQNTFDEMFAAVTGVGMIPANEGGAALWTAFGQMLSAAQLGGASILALLGDTATTRSVRRIAGMPQTSVLKRVVGDLAASDASKEELIRSGIIFENIISANHGQKRFTGEMFGPQWSERIAHVAMNISGLSPITQAERVGFQQEMMGHVASLSNKTWDQLHFKTKRLFEPYGIDAKTWDVIRSVKQSQQESKFFKAKASFISPTDVFDVDRDAAFKYMQMMEHQVNLAVPVSTVRSRVALTGNVKPGTLKGALLQSVAQYKSFPVALYLNNMRQFAHLKEGAKFSKIGYAAQFAVEATILAGIAIQIRQVAAGRDPIPMFDDDGKPNVKFWMSAVAYSGALTIFADFIFADVNRFGGGLAETIAGPRIGFIGDMVRATLGNFNKLIEGKDTKFFADTSNFIFRNLPGVSTFYIRTPLERLINDSLRSLADPKADERAKRIMRRHEREYGNKYWWEIGEKTPSRGPDLSKALGGLVD